LPSKPLYENRCSYDNGNGINQPTNGPFINNYQPLLTTEPPKNWNPLNAPDKELEFYGYPSRPSDKHQFEPWKKIVLAKFHKGPGIPYPSLGISNTRIVQSVPKPAPQPVPQH